LQRDVSTTSERLENTSLSVGRILRKLSAPSIPKLIAATRRQSRRYLRIGPAIVGKLSAQVRACVQGFQRSAAVLRKFSALPLPKLIAATMRQSRSHLRIGPTIVSKLSAQVRACVRGLQRPAELKGLRLKWPFPVPSSSHNTPHDTEGGSLSRSETSLLDLNHSMKDQPTGKAPSWFRLGRRTLQTTR
jgi:hypothetical protein